MKILIVGAGMYVTGRDNTGPGTILSSIAQFSKENHVEEVVVTARKSENEAVVEECKTRINQTLGSDLNISYRSIQDSSDISALHEEYTFDASVVSIPDHLHFEYSAVLLQLGIPCLIVKPLTPTLEEAKQLIQIQEKQDVYAAVEFHKRWDETNLITKRYIQEAKLGKLLYYEVGYSQRISIPLSTFKSWSDKTNIFQYLGVHYVDLFYFLSDGFTPIRCSALGTNGILKEQGIDTFDSVHVMLEWENPENENDKVVSVYNTNWIDPNKTSAMSDQRYKLIGTKGRLEIDQKHRGVEYVSDIEGVQHINPYFSDHLSSESGGVDFQGYGHKSISCFFKDILDLKAGKTTRQELHQLRPDLKHSAVSTAVVEAVNDSLSKDGAWTPVKKVLL